ncbi:MAG: hypothetical protein QXK37_03710 [Candidatus Woesearchaeota archaeon]
MEQNGKIRGCIKQPIEISKMDTSNLIDICGVVKVKRQESIESLIEQGIRFYESGKYVKAIRCFERVYQATKSPESQFYIRRCYEEIGATMEG